MCQWRTFKQLLTTAPKSDIAVLVITFILTVVFDLVVAIEIGMLLSCLLFMKRMSDETGVKSWRYLEELQQEESAKPQSSEQKAAEEREESAEQDKLRRISTKISVYEITGPLFFGAADSIGQIVVRDETKCLILRMRSVPALDSTAMNAMVNLYQKCKKRGIVLLLSHVNEQPMGVMEKAGYTELVGRDNFCRNIGAAINRAESIIR